MTKSKRTVGLLTQQIKHVYAELMLLIDDLVENDCITDINEQHKFRDLVNNLFSKITEKITTLQLEIYYLEKKNIRDSEQ